VVSFVFADLITLPLLSIYRKYYGTAITLRLVGLLWGVMSLGGLAVEYLFRLVRIPPPSRPTMVVHTGFAWNYTMVLDVVALSGFAVVYWLYRHRDLSEGRFATDPICGMQVEIANAPARREGADGPLYFCSDHCATAAQAARS
jgi:YHS domain-containing protein